MSSLLPAVTAHPLKDPLPLLDTNSQVSIFHPKASSGLPILEFHAFPSAPGSGVVGVPVGVVLDACFVLAGNKQGELHLQQNRVAGDDSDPDALLVPGMYHFVVVQPGGALDRDYLLCESFSAWTPPVSIPARWQGGEAAIAPPLPDISDVSAAVKADDKICIMTGARTALQASDIVPKSEGAWFESHFNVLEGYGGEADTDLDSVRNEVALRADLNKQVFGQGLFLFVPYANDVVAVFVQDAAEDLAYEYHLRVVNLPSRIRRGYLFIRFAWNIFNFCAPGLAAAAASNDEDVGGGSGGGNDEDVGGADDGDSDSSLLTYDRVEARFAVFETLDEELKRSNDLNTSIGGPTHKSPRWGTHLYGRKVMNTFDDILVRS
ncbi:hypothetical protein BDZ89DRAFT_1197463 [Hymenopellis radicata]|nr:hypothetical protein BDZ89DRAFT_1197463 [Hymenopellis radicata]